MADALPSADEFFGPAPQQPGGPLQGADDFFAQKPAQSGSYSGTVHDMIWSNPAVKTGAAVLNAYGYGAQYAWGAEPIGLSRESEAGLRHAGIFNDYVKGNTSLIKTANEAILRPAADIADIAGRLLKMPFYVVGAGAQAAAKQIEGEQPTPVTQALATPFGGLGEIAGAIPEGFLPEIGSPPHVAAAERARSIGAIGEGDAGFYDAEPLTPENAHARAQAAEPDAPPVVTRPPPVDVHELAARIDPVTMEEFQQNLDRVNTLMQGREITEGIAGFDAERLARVTETARLRAEDAELEAQAKALPAGDAAATDRLARVRAVEESLKDETLDPATRRELGQRRDELLTDTTPEKLEAAAAPLEQARAIDAQRTQIADNLSRLEAQEASQRAEEIIGPKAADQQQSALIGARLALRDLAPKVGALYEQARDMAPGLPERAEEPTVGVGQRVPRETTEAATGAAAQEQTAQGARAGVQPVPEAASAGAEILPEVSGGVHARVAENAPAERGGAGEELMPEHVRHVPEPGQTGAGAMPGLRVGEGAEAPRGLHEAVAGDMAVPPVPPEEARSGARGGAAPTGRPGPLKPVTGTGPLRTRGLSEGVEAKAIEAGLTANFGDLPEYRQVSMAEQAEAATKLLDADPTLAKDIALGRKQPPKGLLPESVFVAVEKRALADGDVETLRQLATQSRLATEATTMGQRIRTLGERDPTSPVAAIQSIQQAREAALARKGATVEQAKAAEVESMKAEVRKAASKPDAFAAWLDEIKCEA